MSSVQQPPPEDPDALPLHVEEWNYLQPPLLILISYVFQPWPAQFFITAAKSCRSNFLREQRGRFRLSIQANEFGKEATFGKQLMFHDLQNGAGALRRFE